MILHTGSIFRGSSAWSKMARHADNSMDGAFQDDLSVYDSQSQLWRTLMIFLTCSGGISSFAGST